jgi:hypothetical protein
MTKTIVALFDHTNEAERALQELLGDNFPRDAIADTIGLSKARAVRMVQNSGIAHQDVPFYTESVQRGATIVIVRTTEMHVQRAEDLFAKCDTVDIAARRAELKRGGVDTIVNDALRFDALEAVFRIHYTTNNPQSGSSYDQYRAVYRYGYDLGIDERTRHGDWPAIEADARRSWEQRNPDTWDQFKANIRYAWDTTRRQR